MSNETKPTDSTQFEQQAEGGSSGMVREFIDLLAHNKKWWLIPLVAALLVVGLIVVIGGTAAAPFIYTLF